MQVLEVVSAVLAETLIEIGVVILTEPPEIHWSKEVITKLPPAPHGRKGKQVTKNAHGICGKLVTDLAPTLPSESKMEKGKKGAFKPPVKKGQPKKATTKKNSKSLQVLEAPVEEENDPETEDSPAVHKGLPVQGHRGILTSQSR